MKFFTILALLLLMVTSAFPQGTLRYDFGGTNSPTPFSTGVGTTQWKAEVGEGNGWDRYNGIFRVSPPGGITALDTTLGHSGMAYWDSSMAASNFEFQFTLSEETPPATLYHSPFTSTLTFYITSGINALFATQSRGYVIGWTRNSAAPGTPDNWTVARTDTFANDATVPINWKKSGTNTTTASLNKTNTVQIEVRKDVLNTIALLINGIVVDSIQDTWQTTLAYIHVRGRVGVQTQLDNFFVGPQSYAPPPPPPPDNAPPSVGSNFTTPGTGSIDSTRTVTCSIVWSDDSLMYRDSLWEVGVVSLNDTVLQATHNNINSVSDQINSTGGTRHTGTHYYYSTARDLHGNYARSATFSYRVDPVSIATQTSGKWVTGYYPDYANVPHPGQLNWNIWTHIVHFVTRPTLTYTPDPANAPTAHHFTFDNGIQTFENAVGNQNYPVQRQLIDSAHAHGRKVLIGEFGSPVPLYDVSPETLKSYIHSILAYARLRGYDGIDIDWEWPGSAHEGDVWNFFISTLRDSLNTWSPHGILTNAWFQWVRPNVASTINFALASSAVDQNNIMCYDMETGARNVIHAPLYPTDCNLLGAGIGYGTVGDNVPELLHQYQLQGMARSTMGAGVPFYGYQHNGSATFCTASGGGSQVQYFNVFPLYQGGNSTRYTFDNATQTPYLSWTDGSGGHFISFDDSNSATLKAAWVLNSDIGGLMVWEMSQDVARPDGKYIITEGIGKGLGGGTVVIVPATCPLAKAPYIPILSSPANGATNQPSTDTLKITAQANDTVATYELEIATDTAFSRGSIFVDNPNVLSFPYVVTGLQSATTYYWHVKSVNCKGDSGYSARRSFTTLTVVAPPPPPPSPIVDGSVQHYNGQVGRMDFAISNYIPINDVPLSSIPIPPVGVAYVSGSGMKNSSNQSFSFASLVSGGLTTGANTWIGLQTFSNGLTLTNGTASLLNASITTLSVSGTLTSNLADAVVTAYVGVHTIGTTTNPFLCFYGNDFFHVTAAGAYIHLLDSIQTRTLVATMANSVIANDPFLTDTIFAQQSSIAFDDFLDIEETFGNQNPINYYGSKRWGVGGFNRDVPNNKAGWSITQGSGAATDTNEIGWLSIGGDIFNSTGTNIGDRSTGALLNMRGSFWGTGMVRSEKVGWGFKVKFKTPGTADSVGGIPFGFLDGGNGMQPFDTLKDDAASNPYNGVFLQLNDSVSHTTTDSVYLVCAKRLTGVTRVGLFKWVVGTNYEVAVKRTVLGFAAYVNGVLTKTVTTNIPNAGFEYPMLGFWNRSSKVYTDAVNNGRCLRFGKVAIFVPQN